MLDVPNVYVLTIACDQIVGCLVLLGLHVFPKHALQLFGIRLVFDCPQFAQLLNQLTVLLHVFWLFVFEAQIFEELFGHFEYGDDAFVRAGEEAALALVRTRSQVADLIDLKRAVAWPPEYLLKVHPVCVLAECQEVNFVGLVQGVRSH